VALSRSMSAVVLTVPVAVAVRTARLTPWPVLRASVSSIRTSRGPSAGIQVDAGRKTACPSASRLQVARLKNRWNAEM